MMDDNVLPQRSEDPRIVWYTPEQANALTKSLPSDRTEERLAELESAWNAIRGRREGFRDQPEASIVWNDVPWLIAKVRELEADKRRLLADIEHWKGKVDTVRTHPGST